MLEGKVKIHGGYERKITSGAIMGIVAAAVARDHYFTARIGEKVSEAALRSVETAMLQVLFYLHGQHRSSNEASTASP